MRANTIVIVSLRGLVGMMMSGVMLEIFALGILRDEGEQE